MESRDEVSTEMERSLQFFVCLFVFFFQSGNKCLTDTCNLFKFHINFVLTKMFNL